MEYFKFELGQSVASKCGGEEGEVIARAQYSHATDRYLIRYRAANGIAGEAWWSVEALEAVITEAAAA